MICVGIQCQRKLTSVLVAVSVRADAEGSIVIVWRVVAGILRFSKA